MCASGVLVAAIALWIALIPAAHAQVPPGLINGSNETAETVTLPDPLTPEAIRELVSRLSDEDVRRLLLRQLDADVKADNGTGAVSNGDFFAFVNNSVTGVALSVADAVRKVPLIWQGLRTGFANFYEERGASGTLRFFAVLGFAIICGLLAEWIVSQFARRWRARIEAGKEPQNLRETLHVLGSRLALDMIGVFTFLIVTRLVGYALQPLAEQATATVIMVNLVAIPRLVAAFFRFIMAPNRPDLRLVYADDHMAKFFYRNTVGLAILTGFMAFIVQFQAMNGVDMVDTHVGFWLNLAIFVWIVVIGYVGRHGLTRLLIGDEADVTPMEVRVAMIYPWVAMVLVIITWFLVEILISMELFHLIRGGAHFLTLAILVMVPAMDTMIRGLVRHLVPPMQGEGAVAERAYLSTKRAYIRIGRVVMFGFAILLIARLWNIDFSHIASASFGANFAARSIEFLIVLAIGYLIWEIVTLMINRKLADELGGAGFDLEADEPGGGEGGGVGGSRLSTVLPLIRLTAQTAIIVITVLVALGHIGVDITPLLAGAGIVGLAIGFGAQALVRDVVSGLFFLIDDAFRVGEYVVIADTVGTVEKISIRSLQLRHHQGPVHTIPFGEIPKVTNNSRDWVIVKMKFTVPFETDVNKIKRIFKQIGKDIMEAPYAENIIQTFKSQGVYDVDDVGIVVRGKFMAKPGSQWIMRKDIYSRIQKAFEEHGIEFARREVRVNLPSGSTADTLSDADKAAIGAAAQNANEAAQTAAPGKT